MTAEECIAAQHLHAELTELALNLEAGPFQDYLTELAVELRERFDVEPIMSGWVTLA